MERVKTGEKYWFISVLLTVEARYETNSIMDAELFKTNNYFPANEYTPKMVEEMAKKLRAVLKGADVIEMPSEEEICKQSQKEWTANDGTVGDKRLFNDIVLTAYSIIKDKIVK